MAMNLRARGMTQGRQIGLLKATVDFALARDDLREGFAEYLRQKAAEL